MKPVAVVATHPIQYQTPLYRYLTQRGIPIHALFLCKLGSGEGRDAGFGMTVSWDIPLLDGFSYEFVPSVMGDTPDGFFGLMNPGLLTAIDGRRFSAVMVHGWRSLSMLTAVARAKLGQLPVLYRAESNDRMTQTHGGKRRVLSWGLKRVVAACLPIGSLNDQFYANLGVPPSRRFLMPYAVDNERFQAAAGSISKTQARASFGLNADGTVALFVGKLVPWKQPELLLRAFASSAPRDAQLLIAGTGPMEVELRAQADRTMPGRIVFTGFLNQSEIPRAYRAADLLVVPSEYETWGLAVNEGMNFQLPAIVSSTVGCAPDLVEEGVTGEIFEQGDQAQLASQLRALLGDRERLSRMGVTAKQRIDEWSFRECEAGLRSALEAVGAL
jgi:glycosyltransferase involved in cell wall biosynthesis